MGKISKGIGKSPVEQVILTHAHYDHSGGLEAIIALYHPVVLAFDGERGGDRRLVDGQELRIGDRSFSVFHTPGRSDDSICLYCAQDRVLFTGDTLSRISSPGGSYTKAYLGSLEKLSRLDLQVIYPGHGEPITHSAAQLLQTSIQNVRRSHVKI